VRAVGVELHGLNVVGVDGFHGWPPIRVVDVLRDSDTRPLTGRPPSPVQHGFFYASAERQVDAPSARRTRTYPRPRMAFPLRPEPWERRLRRARWMLPAGLSLLTAVYGVCILALIAGGGA
jgi:hypothetical protein